MCVTDIIDVLMSEGPCHFALGDLPAAKACFERALALRKRQAQILEQGDEVLADIQQWIDDCS